MNLQRVAEVLSISELSLKSPEDLHPKIVETNMIGRLVKRS